jgi:outer membrane receptor for ferrienterochelin and colicins
VDAGRTVGPFEVNGTLFASRVEDAVQLVPTGATAAGAPRVRLQNVEGETRTAGTEALVRYRLDDLSLTGSYVFVRSTEPDPSDVSGPSARREVPLTPRHTAGVVAMWEDHDRGLLGVEAYFTGRQTLDDNPFRDRGRPHVHLGVLGELQREGWSVFLNAENLLNVRQTRWDPLVRPDRAPDGRWTVDAWAPLDGFTVNGGVRIRVGGEDHHHH